MSAFALAGLLTFRLNPTGGEVPMIELTPALAGDLKTLLARVLPVLLESLGKDRDDVDASLAPTFSAWDVRSQGGARFAR